MWGPRDSAHRDSQMRGDPVKLNPQDAPGPSAPPRYHRAQLPPSACDTPSQGTSLVSTCPISGNLRMLPGNALWRPLWIRDVGMLEAASGSRRTFFNWES